MHGFREPLHEKKLPLRGIQLYLREKKTSRQHFQKPVHEKKPYLHRFEGPANEAHDQKVMRYDLLVMKRRSNLSHRTANY
jgi:hypothetical protein